MYYVKADNLTLWSPIDNALKIAEPTLKLEVNKIGSFSFNIYPDHPYYGTLQKMKTVISVYQDNRTLFKGRVYSDVMDFRKIKSVEVEGILGYLNDSIIRNYEFNGSVEEYFTFLVNQHNEQVEDFQKFKVGAVTVTGSITRAASGNPTTWDELNEKLINSLGGYISIRYEGDGNYVDYLIDYADTSTQDVAFAVNLLDLELESDADSLVTCVIPYGAANEETGLVTDITSVNNGLDYISDAEAVAKYGRIYEVVTWDDVIEPSTLLSKAKLYLSEKIKLLNTLTVKAIDLHLMDETIEAFKLGDYIKVYSKPHEIDERVLLRSYSVDLSNPAGCTITLGLEKSGFIDAQVGSNKSTANRIDLMIERVEDSTSKITNEVLSETQIYINESVETSEEITRTLLQEYVTVSELETVREETSLSVSQTAEELTLQFDTLDERVTQENDEIVRILNENSKYIRIVDGNIILGETGSLLTTRYANGRISFLYNDTVEVAYISDQKLYITQAEILESIVIGNFAFIPRSNGNLSFKKIK